MIQLKHVTKKYDGVVAVNDFSIEVKQGEICVLIGPSGCGKTTTLRMINRLVETTSGSILINGTDISKIPPEHLRRSIGYAIQNVGLFPHMTVAANIGIVPELLGWEKRRTARRVEELLHLVGLEPQNYAGKYVNQLSGGESQRIGVARALAADPPILLMDEPFGAVDPLTRQRLQAQFQNIQHELRKTIILVTHDLDEAIRLADRIAIMQSGRLIQYDSPETILSKPASKFVHDFVGVDRALKRLLRIEVERFVKPALSVIENVSRDTLESAVSGQRFVWVLNENGRPLGWIDRNDLSKNVSVPDLIVRGDPNEMSVMTTDSLHVALSRMLGLGFRSVPVIDANGIFKGELTISDIEAAMTEVEKANNVE